ncbi:MAG: hypothetical protein JNK82_32790, partial [Myxococcaceae bacterium]|nr:hypothetical protein [Myxococcaceae bacterium]
MRNVFVPGLALVATLALALSSCSTPPPPTPPEPPPLITKFSADQTVVTAGATVKLSFTTERATEVELLDQAGTAITFMGDANGGEATVTPTETSFYVLRATGKGGRDSAFVQVAVNGGLREVFLVAVPAEVEAGGTVTLAWSALGGTGVTVRDANGNTLSSETSGSRTLTVNRTTTYELRATGLSGVLTASASVTVRPVIRVFEANPPAAKQGQKIELHWQTGGADAVSLREATLGELITITSPAAVEDGTFDFIVPAELNTDGGQLLPDGGLTGPRPTPDNFPLQFSLTATTNTPAQSVSADLRSFVRDGPFITSFVVPTFGTELKP